MSTTEILNELPKLKFADRLAILQRLSELETEEEIEPSSDLAAAIEVGLRSAQNEPCYTVEEFARRPGNGRVGRHSGESVGRPERDH